MLLLSLSLSNLLSPHLRVLQDHLNSDSFSMNDDTSNNMNANVNINVNVNVNAHSNNNNNNNNRRYAENNRSDSPIFGSTPKAGPNRGGNPMFIDDDVMYKRGIETKSDVDFSASEPLDSSSPDGAGDVKAYKEKVQRVSKALQKQQEEHKAQLLHIETISMMTKYQLVFIKMETCLMRLGNIVKAREITNLSSGFKAILAFRNYKVMLAKYRANMILNVFTTTMRQFYRTLNRRRKKNLEFALRKLQSVPRRAVLEREIKNRIESEYTAVVLKKEQEYMALTRRLEELNTKLQHHQTKEGELAVKIKNRDKQIAALENELANSTNNNKEARKAAAAGEAAADPSEVRMLENHLKELEAENAELKDKLSLTEINVSTFIKEMSELLDSHELSTNACSEDNNNSLNNSNNVNYELNDIDDEFIENVQAKTKEKGPTTYKGGSSQHNLQHFRDAKACLLYTSPSPRDGLLSRMPSSA
eukprot:TRINITY_DN8901_c0_g1_i1.p1 TRINITY_DN8901_c0_g1~~TRINITY_DN8901_c0_g1_i1.p1  ORF type:complete len:475 (-),score=119.30 TRINITY_DN8901_c0_g1_i1:66-1490(-)